MSSLSKETMMLTVPRRPHVPSREHGRDTAQVWSGAATLGSFGVSSGCGPESSPFSFGRFLGSLAEATLFQRGTASDTIEPCRLEAGTNTLAVRKRSIFNAVVRKRVRSTLLDPGSACQKSSRKKTPTSTQLRAERIRGRCSKFPWNMSYCLTTRDRRTEPKSSEPAKSSLLPKSHGVSNDRIFFSKWSRVMMLKLPVGKPRCLLEHGGFNGCHLEPSMPN